jgi:hypothetical protein
MYQTSDKWRKCQGGKKETIWGTKVIFFPSFNSNSVASRRYKLPAFLDQAAVFGLFFISAYVVKQEKEKKEMEKERATHSTPSLFRSFPPSPSFSFSLVSPAGLWPIGRKE